MPRGNGQGSVDLLERDDQSQFMWERSLGQRPKAIRLFAHRRGVAIGSADQNGDAAIASEFLLFDEFCEIGTGELLTAFVHDDTETADGFFEKLLFFCVTGAKEFEFKFGHSAQATGVFLDSGSGERKLRFANGQNAPAH